MLIIRDPKASVPPAHHRSSTHIVSRLPTRQSNAVGKAPPMVI
jgi:hypothetical protein